MVRQARDAGIALSGSDGLLKALTTQVVEATLGGELNEHLGCDRHDPVGRGTGNSCNGIRSKTVLTGKVGAIQIEVPRERNGGLRAAVGQEVSTPFVGYGPEGCVLHGLRRAQRLAGQHREDVQPSEGSNLFHSPVAQ